MGAHKALYKVDRPSQLMSSFIFIYFWLVVERQKVATVNTVNSKLAFIFSMQMDSGHCTGKCDHHLDEPEKKSAGRDILRGAAAAAGGIPGQGRPDSLPDLPPATISP